MCISVLKPAVRCHCSHWDRTAWNGGFFFPGCFLSPIISLLPKNKLIIVDPESLKDRWILCGFPGHMSALEVLKEKKEGGKSCLDPGHS